MAKEKPLGSGHNAAVLARLRAARGRGESYSYAIFRIVRTDASRARRQAALLWERSDAPDLQCLGSPHHEFVEPRLGGSDDFRVHRFDQPVDR
jgi:hypothetical protein